MPSVLAHLAEKYADQQENLASDALAFVLRESRSARDALADMLGEGIHVAAVARERFLANDSRPDFSVLGPTGALTALVEAKFWFGLMEETQPRGYLRRLAEQGGKALLFVVPEERIPSLTVKLAALARLDDPGLGPWSSPGAIRTTRTSAGVAMKLTSWRHVLATLRGAWHHPTVRALRSPRPALALAVDRPVHSRATGPPVVVELRPGLAAAGVRPWCRVPEHRAERRDAGQTVDDVLDIARILRGELRLDVRNEGQARGAMVD